MLLAYYDGKVVDMAYIFDRVADKRQRFHLACCRVTDNARGGYIVEDGKVYSVSRSYRSARIVRGEARDEVLAEVGALLPLDTIPAEPREPVDPDYMDED